MPRRGPSLRQLVHTLNVSEAHDVLRPHYKKWERGDGNPGRPPHDPAGMVQAMLIMGIKEWGREDFRGFLANHPEWLHFLGFDRIPCESSWSKLLDRVPVDALEALLSRIVQRLVDDGFFKLHVAAVDGSFLPGCPWDPDAAWGYVCSRTRWEERQTPLPYGSYRVGDDVVLGYGYRVHVLVDTGKELPVTVHVTRANENDVGAWPALYDKSKAAVPWDRVGYLVGDRAYDAGSVRACFKHRDVTVVTPAANTPKDVPSPGLAARLKEVYRERDAVERFFSMLKGFFSLFHWGVVGFDRVRKWTVLACLACVVVGYANHRAGRPVKSVKAFARMVG